MENREHKGKVYIAVSKEQLVPLANLRCHIFVYLKLNDRMLKVREQFQQMDEDLLRAYVKKGHSQFYILDPVSNPGTYAFEGASSPPNPVISEEVYEAGQKIWEREKEKGIALTPVDESDNEGRRKKSAEAERAAAVVVGEEERPEASFESNAAPTIESKGEETTLANAPEAEADITVVASSAPTAEDVVKLASSQEASVEEAFSALSEDPLTEQRFNPDSAEALAEQAFSPDAAKKLEEERFGKDNEVLDKSEQHFGSSDGTKSSAQSVQNNGSNGFGSLKKAFGSERAEASEKTFSTENEKVAKDNSVRTFKAEDGEDRKLAEVVSFSTKAGEDSSPSTWLNRVHDLASAKIKEDIKTLEEQMADSSGDEQLFIQSLEAPQEKLLEADPSLGVARSVAQHLGKLRGEIAATVSVIPSNFGEKVELAQRRENLKEEIAKFESTSAILESIDENFSGTAELPGNLAGKSKDQLISELESNLGAMRGSVVLSEAGFGVINEKIQNLKAGDAELSISKSQQQSAKVSEKLEALKTNASDPEALKRLQAEVTKEIKQAQASAGISRSLTGLRNELAGLIGVKAKSATEQAKLEGKAAELKASIRQLEQMSVTLEMGEEISPSALAAFGPDHAEIHGVEFGEATEVGMKRLIGELGKLEATVVAEKKEAFSADTQLKAKILGGPDALNGPAPSREELAGATHVDALDRARDLILEQQKVITASGKAVTPAQLREIQDHVTKEIRVAETVMHLENKLSSAQMAISELFEAKKEGKLSSEEMEAQAMLIQKDIQFLQSLKGDVQLGKSVDSARLEAFVSPAKPIDFGEGGMAQMLASIETSKAKAVAATVKAIRSEIVAAENTCLNGSLELKKGAVDTRPLEGLEKTLSRHLRAFVETGKNPSSHDLWEINHAIAKTVQAAKAGEAIAAEIVRLADEHRTLLNSPSSDESERASLITKSNSMKQEIRRLNSLCKAIERGAPLDSEAVKPFVSPMDEVFIFKADAPPAETLTQILNSVEETKAQYVDAMMKAADSNVLTMNPGPRMLPQERASMQMFKGAKRDHRNDEAILVDEPVIDSSSAEFKLIKSEARDFSNMETKVLETEKDKTSKIKEHRRVPIDEKPEAVVRLVSDAEEQRLLQAGVYATTLFRAFGYRDDEVERDMMLACILGRFSEEQIKGDFSDQVLAFYRAAKGIGVADEMLMRDLKQAMNLAFGYVDLPGVITGTYALNPGIFGTYCTEVISKVDEEADPELVERARQNVVFGFAGAERDELVALAKASSQRLGEWKQSKAS